MYEIKNQKNALRRGFIEKRKALPKATRDELDAKLRERFLALVTYRYADILLLYAPKEYEIDVMPIAYAALEAGKKIAFPRCFDTPDGTHRMAFHIVSSPDELVVGAYGIREPLPDMPLYDKHSGENAVIIVPALSYDRKGYRLGYGGGYYDRFLPGFHGTTVGLVYCDFMKGDLPKSRYDLPVDVVINERKVTAVERRPSIGGAR